jgi:hypothetical protein
VPTLIVWGTRDVFFALKWAQRLSELIPGTTKVATLDGARMHFPDERAAEFLPLVCAMASAKRSNAEKEKPMSDPGRLPGLAGPGNWSMDGSNGSPIRLASSSKAITCASTSTWAMRAPCTQPRVGRD